MNSERAKEILLTHDGLGIKSKQAALEYVQQIARESALHEAADALTITARKQYPNFVGQDEMELTEAILALIDLK